MMRSMSSTCGKIHEEWSIGSYSLLEPHPCDCLVCHVSGEMIIRVMRHFYLSDTIINQWSILIGFSPDEAVELIEAGMSLPAVIRTRNRNFPGRRFMIFTEDSRAVTILAKHFGHRRDGLRTNTCVSRKCRREFHNSSRIVAMVIVACQQRSAGWRTQCGCMKTVVTDSSGCQFVQCGHIDGSAKGAGGAKANIINQHDDDIGCTFGCLHFEPRRSLGFARIELGDGWVFWLTNGKNRPVDPVRRDLLLRSGEAGQTGCRQDLHA